MLSKVQIDDQGHSSSSTIRLLRSTRGCTTTRRNNELGSIQERSAARMRLFNMYSEMILRHLADCPERIVVNGIKINNLRYTIPSSLRRRWKVSQKSSMMQSPPCSEQLGLQVNGKKANTHACFELGSPTNLSPNARDTPFEYVPSSVYLGALVTADARRKKEIRRRISSAKATFTRLRAVSTDRKFSIYINIRPLKAFVWPTLLYGCESWTLAAETRRRVGAAEMWLYRRMLRVS